MTEFAKTVDRYIAIWNEIDPNRRQDLVAQTFVEDAKFVDPLVDIGGHDAIDTNIASIQAQFPDHFMRLAGPVDEHHNLVRFTWEVVPNDSDESYVVGTDVAILSEDGKIQVLHGFLDKVPALT